MAGHASVREVRDEELEAVLTLWREAYGTVGVTDSLGDVLQAASGGTSVVLVAEEKGRLVGTVIGGFDGWRGNIYRLAVHPEHQRQGMLAGWSLTWRVASPTWARSESPPLSRGIIPGPRASGTLPVTLSTQAWRDTCATSRAQASRGQLDPMAGSCKSGGSRVRSPF